MDEDAPIIVTLDFCKPDGRRVFRALAMEPGESPAELLDRVRLVVAEEMQR